MILPKALFNKYLARFDELIAKGEAIQKTIKIEPGGYSRSRFSVSRFSVYGDEEFIKHPDKVTMDYDAFEQWIINYDSFLYQILPANHINQKLIDGNQTFFSNESQLKFMISALKAVKEDFEQGFLGDLMLQIESEIAADYMGQAEQLLAEGTTGKYDHVPAAVLSGAVLEKALRTLCDKQNPPISTIKPNGDSKTLNPLIDDLKKANFFNELKAKQLKSWADIRNKAAHGEFTEFKRSDVELMIKGIENFLADYMT
ncbi:DUF4145 domain-containing protein [Trichormus sp. NMC-1]|uniref:DUF4145 domain-containing protein n=1 Tax=Trichormus sp. NMC-1 TaxID=1853259 RepID=UPI0008DC12C2|nr:DUF4145 domain-containing protein [Trichormus sp. NMC-1]